MDRRDTAPITEAELRTRFRFAEGLRFDLIYSLEVLLNPAAQLHLDWKRDTWARLPSACREEFSYFQDSARFWLLVGDAIGAADPPDDFGAILSLYETLSPDRFRLAMLEGALHDTVAAERIAQGGLTLEQAVLQAPAQKREWLEHIELYPPGLRSPTFEALARVASDPHDAKSRVVRLLAAYWNASFERTWADLRPRLRRSLAEKERLLQSCTLEEFFRIALLRVEADDEARCLRAIRGGYRLPYASVCRAFVVPSAFNHHRFWTAFDEEEGTVVFLPYFDASVAPESESAPAGEPAMELDPVLIFKALGDPTRFAIARLIARKPATSADLAAALALSRPTISHHVVLLREAGLLREEAAGGSIILHLNREPLRGLSEAVLRRLAAAPPEAGPDPDRPPRARRRGPRRRAARGV